MIIKDNYYLKRSDIFTLTPREEITVDLSLSKVPIKPCTLLLGIVEGRFGRIKNATVKIFDKSFKPIAHTLTDEKGCLYYKNTLPCGEYYVIATAEGYYNSEAYRVWLHPKKPSMVTVWLEVCYLALQTAVYGIVYDELNIPLENVNIAILEDNKMERLVAITQTNEDGEYLTCGLKAGKYRISATKEGYILPQNPTFTLYPKNYSCLNLFLYPDPHIEK